MEPSRISVEVWRLTGSSMVVSMAMPPLYQGNGKISLHQVKLIVFEPDVSFVDEYPIVAVTTIHNDS